MSNLRKSVFHYTKIESCLDIIKEQKIKCNSVKNSILNQNEDFLISRYLVPKIIDLFPEMDPNELKNKCLVFLYPLIYTSYIFSTTSTYGNNYHWSKYAKKDGCCIQMKSCSLREAPPYIAEHPIYYNKKAFDVRAVSDFIRHYIEKKIGDVPKEAATGFIKAVCFSKYPNYNDDKEYRFVYGDLLSIEDYEKRKDPNFSIPPLDLEINPETSITKIYFITQSSKSKFLDELENNRNFWEKRVFLLNNF